MKIFVLGLDGATFDFLNPLLDEGCLPNIQLMMSEGVSGRLQTIFPPVTAPAWLALATGLNPGKTGVFDYINRADADSNEYIPISSSYYDGRAVWNYLNKSGLSVGIFNYPTLSPPPHVNGFAVSGMGGRKGEIAYPADLESEIDRLTNNGYECSLNLRKSQYSKDINLFFNDIERIFGNQTLILKYLIKNKNWDFFFGVFSITDWLGHVLWKDIDIGHPLNDPDRSPVVYGKFKNIWRNIDNVIGELSDSLSKDTQFIIVSDHGMGPLTSVFYPNTWLKDMGWLQKKELGWKGFLAERLRLFSEGFDNKYTNAILYRIKSKLLKIQGTVDFIDYNQSMAYSPEHNTMFGCINLTRKGKAAKGFKKKLIDAIQNLPSEFLDISSVDIFMPEEIFSGSYVNLSPDIFFIINNYQSTIEIDFTQRPFVNEPSIALRTGGHQPDGIFIAKGSHFRQNTEIHTSILDIAPTILSLYQLKIPSLMDGNIIVDGIKHELMDEIATDKTETDIEVENQKKGMRNGDLNEMKKMLKSLGYL